jgi:hypothetical protein
MYINWVKTMSENLLVRFRDKDTGEGVTRKTLKHLAKALGLSETEAVHRALVEYARKCVPLYMRDQGPLTDAQRARITQMVSDKHGDAIMHKSLFGQPQRKASSRASKRVSAPRNR